MVEEEEPQTSSHSQEAKIRKTPKRGIIYLSTIPPYMNVTKIREVFSEFGTIGRVYLQLAETESQPNKKLKKKKIVKKFTEGWVEFEKKSVAKKVAQYLNNTQVSTRKKSRHYDCMWNIKYLSNFKWTHLHERLAYEKAARRQKLRAEIQLAKRKSNFFTINLDKQKNKTYVNKELENINNVVNAKEETEIERKEFLHSLFT